MNLPMPIYSKTIPRSDLTPAQVGEMFQLLAEHFDGVTQEQFTRDLMEKNRVILLLRDNRLVGFSTLLAYAATFEGETLNVIYSGDTIVAPEAWGTTSIATRMDCCRERMAGAIAGGSVFLVAAYVGIPHLSVSAGVLARILSTL